MGVVDRVSGRVSFPSCLRVPYLLTNFLPLRPRPDVPVAPDTEGLPTNGPSLLTLLAGEQEPSPEPPKLRQQILVRSDVPSL